MLDHFTKFLTPEYFAKADARSFTQATSQLFYSVYFSLANPMVIKCQTILLVNCGTSLVDKSQWNISLLINYEPDYVSQKNLEICMLVKLIVQIAKGVHS